MALPFLESSHKLGPIIVSPAVLARVTQLCPPIQYPAYFKDQLRLLNRATQLFAIIVTRSGNAVHILTIV